MIFGSVCSGIEAATVAWTPLGWKAAWYAEIEKFPSRVLAARHGETPNLGDMTKLHDTEEFRGSNLDVLVGGTPCQSFSVAGLRKGLADPRGNLALVFLGLIDRSRPRWVVWENVPGVLSSWSDVADSEAHADDAGGNRDLFGGPVGPDRGGSVGDRDAPVTVDQTNDFDTFTRGLSELGYGVAWAVLDAQYFGVPQRRERVFVVAHLGAVAPAEAVLFDECCLRGDTAPRRETGEEPTGTISARTTGGGGLGTDFDLAGGIQVAKALNAKGGSGRQDAESETFIAHTLRGEGFDASEDGTGRGTPIVPVSDVAGTISANHGNIRAEDACAEKAISLPPLSAQGGNNGGGAGALTHVGDAVRRLTPRECERLQGFPDDYTMIPGGNRTDEDDYSETVQYLIASGYTSKEAMALADTPDGPRYKALGNSMAVPVMKWIGERIAQVDAIVHPKNGKKIWP